MKLLWDGMLKEYVEHLKAIKDVEGLNTSELRCDWFLDKCVETFRDKYADEFKTTLYGEKQIIIDEEEWCFVSQIKY
jgi:hypothetical protein